MYKVTLIKYTNSVDSNVRKLWANVGQNLLVGACFKVLVKFNPI